MYTKDLWTSTSFYEGAQRFSDFVAYNGPPPEVISQFDEDKTHFYLRVKALNVNRENISVTIDSDNDLIVALGAGNKATVALPKGVDEGKIYAELNYGVLTVIMPKVEKKPACVVNIR